MKQFSFQVTEEQYQRLKDTAQRLGVSMASLCREALGRHLVMLEQRPVDMDRLLDSLEPVRRRGESRWEEPVDLDEFFSSFEPLNPVYHDDGPPVSRAQARTPKRDLRTLTYSLDPDQDELMELWLR